MAVVADLMDRVEEIAPRALAAEWDRVGLQVGDPASRVETVLVALDLTLQVLERAEAEGAQLLLLHHPLFFESWSEVRTDRPEGRLLGRLLAAGRSVLVAHTNWDAAPQGLNHHLAALLGLHRCRVLEPVFSGLHKVVVFVPRGHEEAVRQAMAEAGAGWIGNYRDCAFLTEGTGTFRAQEGAHPFLGKVGELERAAEVRLETVVDAVRLNQVLRAMRAAHPYEEVAYDVYALARGREDAGLGRVGELVEPCTLAQLAHNCAELLHASSVRTVGDPSRAVRRVAVVGGSGAEALAAAGEAGADALVTGDVRYHQARQAHLAGLGVVDAGHWATEAFSLEILAGILRTAAAGRGMSVRVVVEPGEDPFWVMPPPSLRPARPGTGGEAEGVWTVFTDGASRGNPGDAGIGVVIRDPSGRTVCEVGEYVGRVTNNVAEYLALERGLKELLRLGARRISLRADSELLVRQLQGVYQVKNAGLRTLFTRVEGLLRRFETWEARHVPRRENAAADELANHGIDAAVKPQR